MIRLSLVLFAVSVLAGIFAFTDIAPAAIGVARATVLFALILFAAALTWGLVDRRRRL